MSVINRLLLKLKKEVLPSVTVATSARSVSRADAFRGAFVSNRGAGAAVTFSLPEAIPGMRVTAVVEAAFELRLDPSGTETIALPSSGVQGAAGKYLTGDAVGESVSLVCLVAGTWSAVGPIDGTWAHEG